MKQYKNLIFDCDGTLLDSNKAVVKAFDSLLYDVYNRHLTKEEIDEVFHRTTTESLYALEIPLTNENLRALDQYYNDEADKISLFSGIEEVLEKLKNKGIKITMATNRNERDSMSVINKNSLNNYLDGYSCSDFVKNAKPSGEMLKYLIDKYDYDNDKTIFLGNSTSDHLAAIDADIDYAYCMWGTDTTLEEDSIIIESPMDILELIGEKNDTCK